MPFSETFSGSISLTRRRLQRPHVGLYFYFCSEISDCLFSGPHWSRAQHSTFVIHRHAMQADNIMDQQSDKFIVSFLEVLAIFSLHKERAGTKDR